MAKLTETQLIVLSAAASRDDGCATLPSSMKKPAAAKVGTSLIARKLMREMKAKPGLPVWREDGDGRAYSLIITAAGRKAIGAEDEAKDGARTDTDAKRAKQPSDISATTTSTVNIVPRAGSKQALVIDLLSAQAGTTIDALVDATGWLPHTTRAALTGLRKKGLAITRERQQGKASVYRIVDAAA